MATDISTGGGGTAVGVASRIPTSASSDSSTFLNHGAELEGLDRAPSPNPFQDPPYRSNVAITMEGRGVGGVSASPRAVKRSRPHSELLEGDAVKNAIIRRSEWSVKYKQTYSHTNLQTCKCTNIRTSLPPRADNLFPC